MLKAQLAKIRSQLIASSVKKESKVAGFEVKKSGDARVSLIGYTFITNHKKNFRL